jgi:hypothetical protein
MLLFGGMPAFTQGIRIDSSVQHAILVAPSHSAAIGQVQFVVQNLEKARFDKFLGIGKARLLKKEGIKESQWYGNETISKVSLGSLSQMLHEINYHKAYRKEESKPTLFFWPDFYQDYVGTQCVSPFNFQAQDFYQFTHLSDTLVQGQACLKIKVEPKYQADRLFSGVLTLSLDGWLVRWNGTILSDDILYEMDLQHRYFNQKWLPYQALISVHGGVLGIKGDYVLQEKVIGEYKNWPHDPQLFKQPKKAKEILNISERAFDEVFASQLLDNLHQGLLRKWKQRPQSEDLTLDSVLINLQASENHVIDPFIGDIAESTIETAVASYDLLPKSPFNPSQLIFSKSFYFGHRKNNFYPFEIYYKTPVFDSNYNTVEGFVVNSALVFKKRWAPYHFLEAEFLGRRSFGLNRNTGFMRLRYKTETFEVQAMQADYIAQFHPDNTISPEMNSLSTLLLKNNQMKIYRKEFWNLSFVNRFSSRFYAKALFESSRQSQMDNTTDYYWVNYLDRKFSSNNPTNEEFTQEGFATHYSFVTQFQLGFRPFLDHSYENNKRLNEWSSSPLIVFKYRAGWPTLFQSTVNFQTLELAYIQNISLSPWIKSGFIINAGTFIGDKPVYFQDFKHFNGGLSLLQTSEMLASHRLVGYYQNLTSGANQRLNVNHYSYSTAGNYIEALSQFQFSSLWLKPLIGNKQLYVKEMLIANAYYIHNQRLYYNEIGYGLDGVLKVLRLEAIANFSNGQFNYVGFRVNINSRIRIGNIPD